MGLSEEYREKIEEIGESTEILISRNRAFRWKKFLDQILPFVLVSILFVIVFGFFIPVTSRLELFVNYLNWTVIAYFGVRLLVEFRLSDHRDRFARNHWMDFMLLIPAFSLLKEIRLVKFLSSLEFFEEEAMVSGAAVKEAGVGARMGRITKIIKKSIGL